MVHEGGSAAIPFFRRAVELDPNFAMAYARMGARYDELGRSALAAENIRKAYELRNKVSERERLYIETHYYESVTGDLERAVPSLFDSEEPASRYRAAHINRDSDVRFELPACTERISWPQSETRVE